MWRCGKEAVFDIYAGKWRIQYMQEGGKDLQGVFD